MLESVDSDWCSMSRNWVILKGDRGSAAINKKESTQSLCRTSRSVIINGSYRRDTNTGHRHVIDTSHTSSAGELVGTVSKQHQQLSRCIGIVCTKFQHLNRFASMCFVRLCPFESVMYVDLCRKGSIPIENMHIIVINISSLVKKRLNRSKLCSQQ